MAAAWFKTYHLGGSDIKVRPSSSACAATRLVMGFQQ